MGMTETTQMTPTKSGTMPSQMAPVFSSGSAIDYKFKTIRIFLNFYDGFVLPEYRIQENYYQPHSQENQKYEFSPFD